MAIEVKGYSALEMDLIGQLDHIISWRQRYERLYKEVGQTEVYKRDAEGKIQEGITLTPTLLFSAYTYEQERVSTLTKMGLGVVVIDVLAQHYGKTRTRRQK